MRLSGLAPLAMNLRGTLRALGLGRIGRSAEHQESPQLLGMLRKVRHLVQVEASAD